MSSNTDSGDVIHVSKKGQATIPKDLREKFGIETPGKVLIHEEDGKIVVEPLPSVKDMQGVHGEEYEEGEVLEHLTEMKEEDKNLEREQDEKLGRH
ncbi:AbrB/MazE/SpoVT family DNA-binding domain-containing protein (plasmid) [Halorutilales archaeon Cl-col2-1]